MVQFHPYPKIFLSGATLVDEIICRAVHTAYQPPVEAWRCPDCGRGPNDDPQGLVIDEPDESANENCSKLHASDYLICYHCDYAVDAVKWSNQLQAAAQLVPCTHCGGSGLVKKE